MVKAQAKNFKNYIGGQWVPSINGKTFENLNPSDVTQVIGYFPKSSVEDVAMAVAAAKGACRAWKDSTPSDRAIILLKVA